MGRCAGWGGVAGVGKAVVGAVMTVHKITAGDGYTYLTRQVAAGDSSLERGKSAAEYYSATGNPPGRWVGRGLGALGLSGRVSEEQTTALFGLGLHPNAEAIMGEFRREHVRAGMGDQQLATINERARKAAALGRPFANFEDLGPFDERVALRLEAIRREAGREPTAADEKKIRREEARRQRRAVAGFDLVFTPVASVSRLWGLDPRAWVREAIEQAHDAARDAALRLLEENAAHTRTGSSGQAQIETHGLIAAMFDHADNRLGEPNLHSHVAVSSKVLGVDGKWRALDARGLYRMTVAASELYNTVLEHGVHDRLGVEFEARPGSAGRRESVREIRGFPPGVLAHFTRRRAGIEGEYQKLVREFRDRHGRDPSLAAAHELAQQATLATRKGKKPPRAWSATRDEWRASLADAFGPRALAGVMALVPDRAVMRGPHRVRVGDLDVPALAGRVVAEVQERHATWTRWSVLAQAQRELRGVRFADAAEQERAIALIVETALSAQSLSIEPPDVLAEPAALRRSDGSSVFTQHGAARYTSQAVLDAEQRLVDATGTATTVGVDGQTAVAALAAYEQAIGRVLDPGQRALATSFACDRRLLLAGIGPAGAGKTTAMKALAEIIAARETGRLVPLATSASAAGALAEELGTGAENLHKFLWEWTRGPHAEALADGRRVPPGAAFFALHPGDVVLVDEAGMAGTLNLDRLVHIAAQRGAVVRLLGDYRQLGAVESGGALRLIARQPGAVELTVIYRFANPAEAEATLKIRSGDATGLDFYEGDGRVRHGSRQAMTEAAYAGWKADMLAGRTALMAASTNADVTELCARARADRVAAGQVEAGGVRLRDGNCAGVGDWIVTRGNDRRLRSGVHDFVKNGDAWRVLERRDDGTLIAAHLERRGRVRLPPQYVAANVELLYATTAHRAQGSTVDACHALVTGDMGRENFYVTVSRARHATVLYVATHELASLDEDEHVDAVTFDADAYAAREILERIVAREGAEVSATEQIRAAFDAAESLATLVPRYLHALDVATEQHYRQLVERVIPELAEEITADPAWHAVLRALRDAEAAGWDAPGLLANTTRRRELGTAQSLAQVVSWRLRQVVDNEQPPVAGAEPTPARAGRYRVILAGLAPRVAAEIAPAPALAVPAARASAGSDQDYLSALHATIGTVRVNRARNEVAWPVLLLALRRADDLGHDPADVLRAAIDRRELRSAGSVSQPLALRIHRYLAARSDEPAGDARTAWPRIVRLLARLEESGTGPEAALSEAVRTVAGAPGRETLTALAGHLGMAVRRLDTPQVPAWLCVARHLEDPAWRPYLASRAELIRRRVDALTEDATSTRPAWTRHLGDQPDDPVEREQWLRHVSTLAAYRDEYQVTEDDPECPLGPYPGRGRAGHEAYRVAAASLLALRGPRTHGNAEWGRLAADCFRSLDADEQRRIACRLAEQLGPHWLGDVRDPASAGDQPAYRDRLAVILVERGHLYEPASVPADGPAENQPPVAPAMQRRARQGRGARPRSEPSSGIRRAAAPTRQPTPPTQRPPQPAPDQPPGPRLGR